MHVILARLSPAHIPPTASIPSEPERPSRLEGLKRWLALPRARVIVLLFGVMLVVPSITNYLLTDDHLQALRRMPQSPIPEIAHSYFDLFTFGKPGEINQHFMDRGILLPWWTDPEYLVSFFRPLSALTHDLDGVLWPRWPAMAHVQTIVWYAILLAVVSCVYQRLLQPPWLAGLALLLYVLDDTHGDALSWIANRHAVIATIFGLLALLAHDRCRRDETSLRHAWMGPACLAIGLLAGESAIITLAFLASYALFLDAASKRSRVLSLLPYAAVTLAWRIVYQRHGYGAFASDGYLDASREPAAFLARLPATMAVLLQAQFSFIPADAWAWNPERVAAWVLGCAVVLVAMLTVVVVPVVRDDRRSRFWCASLLGALLPISGGIPCDRALVFPSVAAMALLAQVFATFAERFAPQLGASDTARTSVGRTAGILTVVILGGLFARKVVFAPLLVPLRAHGLVWFGGLNDRAERAVPDVPNLDKRTIVIANTPTNDLASCLLLIRATRGESIPRRVRWLSAGSSEVVLTRTSERSLLVRPAKGFLVDLGDRIFRGSRRPMKLGETVTLSDMSVTITDLLADGRPAAAEFLFGDRLESPAYVWRRWSQQGCETLRLPVVGETITLPAIDTEKLVWDKLD